MLKEMTYNIDLKTCDAIVRMAVDGGADVLTREGVLNDEYIFENVGLIIGKRQKARKYVIITADHLNEWSSGLIAIFTDNKNKFDKYYNEFEKDKNIVE